eukprot:CAMPEP_0116947232 /NCGR_PEP_ID=MMETSP0467-20121206/37529_1 /TAXON_ID=283647 /ORGANISM="Mesodinium pulex, Strain SPMC105" /LENGTH=70 /DNA_ID=CAMNT_0004631303 /DNA_START=305 /DNA_END=517 /DNA_ORIENTATION=+
MELVQEIEDIDTLKYYLRTDSINDYIEMLVRCLRFMPKVFETEPWSTTEYGHDTLDAFEDMEDRHRMSKE